MAKSSKRSVRSNLPAVQAQHGGERHIGSAVIRVDAVYHVPAVHRPGPGRWSREADKIAWTDASTGLGCIIRRERSGGHLAGYVGVGPDHPLFGVEWQAIPASLDIEVHGGISYAAACDESGPEEIAVCHVPRGTSPGSEGHVWWMGFECNHITDLVPDRTDGNAGDTTLVHGVTPVYRDEAYVFGQVTDLAAQLAAIAKEEDKPPRISPSPPPIGLDPYKARARR